MPEVTRSAPTPVSEEHAEGQDKRLAKQVISELVRQCPWKTQGGEGAGLGRETINRLSWLAHLSYARNNPGYLTAWPFIRTSWGVQFLDDLALPRELVEEQFVRVEETEHGPFSVAVYFSTGKQGRASAFQSVHLAQLRLKESRGRG